MSEMRGFLQTSKENDINIVDCGDITTLMSDFNNEINRWKSLGVDGLVIFSGETYTSTELFSLLKKIRAEAPYMICMGDTSFDDSAEILSDPELMQDMEGFILVNEFLKKNNDEAELAFFNKMREDYAKVHGVKFDLWYMHAYNMIRMIGDTAVKHNTTDGANIARILHNEGYDGLCQEFSFNENGSQKFEAIQYYIMKNDGTTKEITVDE